MREPRLYAILSTLSWLALSGCAAVRPKGPSVSLCFVEASRQGIECAMKDNTQVFLRWDELDPGPVPGGAGASARGAGFLQRFDGQVLVPRDDFSAIIKWGARK